ncbi:MAG: extracellular solute-binding protein [Caldilineaceae bacterium]
MPKDFNPLVLFVNTELAEQAGVDPSSIQSWEDLQAAAAALTQGEGAGQTVGLCFDPNILRFAPFFFQQGNPIIEDGQAVFNQEGGVAAPNSGRIFRRQAPPHRSRRLAPVGVVKPLPREVRPW